MAPREAVAGPADPAAGAAGALSARYRFWPTRDVLADFVGHAFPGKAVLVSSFGADSAVLLHMVATIDPGLPVIFVDTGKLFPDTGRHRDALVRRFGLTDVRVARPAAQAVAAADPEGSLWLRDPDRCCGVRKVAPLADALAPFAAWISGRKRYQGGARASLPLVEAEGPRVKLNPLAAWSAADVAAYRRLHALPEHPLVAEGYSSIGCVPCTDRVGAGEAERDGRWRGSEKTECGIHFDLSAFQSDGSGI
ncbi:phosphoadenylyl-sulfate reductase [Propylenella binzhouense]|uniref:Adenosine 5'-phosphosulfate reductase n=1 Tax=Propylenella binzhouense TaxID=2555902 RepID=A0A964WVX0_9HYPH|nr:phosphoadenylyl-sulfate reductase [Propylenella binzhouense]MYZ50479.1 phosphoadenylyl-sulfate reductase [Propylenella binzhouense]